MNALLTPTFDELLIENESLHAQLEQARRTDKEIVDQTNKITGIIYAGLGYTVSPSEEFHTAIINRHPHEAGCWLMACEIQAMMTGADVEDALDSLADDKNQDGEL